MKNKVINKIDKDKIKDVKNKKVKLKVDKEKTRKNVEKTIEEYKSFAIKGNIVELAIGMVIGSAFTSIVNAFVNTTITPLISIFTNKVDFSKLFISLSGKHFDTIEQAKEAGALIWNYGALINAILNFFIVSFILFLVVKYLNKRKNKDLKEEEKVKENTLKECPYCLSEIPQKAVRCPYCTSNLKEKKDE